MARLKKEVSNATLDALISAYAKHKHTADTEQAKADALKADILAAAGANPDDQCNYAVHGRGEYTNSFFTITYVEKTIGYPDGVAEEIATLKARIAELEKLKITGFQRYDMRAAKK